MRIAVVDDDDAVREGIALVLQTADREVDTFRDGLAFAQSVEAGGRWNAAFLDLKMPGLSGFDVLRRLSDEGGAPLPFPVVMISAHGDVQAAVQAMRLGASGFVEKPFTPGELEEAVSYATVAAGDGAEAGAGAGPDRETLLSGLTPREREVAELLDRGLSNKEAARDLGCSPRTVEIHRSRVFAKLEVRNVAGLVRVLSGR